jgi:hypothetical protein
MDLLPHLSDNARVWISGFSKALNQEQQELVQSSYKNFLSSWKSHGKELKGDYDMLHGRFNVLALENPDDASGCSIDASVGILKELKRDHQLDALGATKIFFEKDGEIECVERPEFSKLCRTGVIQEDSTVFHLLHQSLGELRDQGLRLPFAKSWHAKAFRLPQG